MRVIFSARSRAASKATAAPSLQPTRCRTLDVTLEVGDRVVCHRLIRDRAVDVGRARVPPTFGDVHAEPGLDQHRRGERPRRRPAVPSVQQDDGRSAPRDLVPFAVTCDVDVGAVESAERGGRPRACSPTLRHQMFSPCR